MLNRKGFALFELLIVIVIIACVGGFIYFSLTEKKEPEVTPTITTVPSPTSINQTFDYKNISMLETVIDSVNGGTYKVFVLVETDSENLIISDENFTPSTFKTIYTITKPAPLTFRKINIIEDSINQVLVEYGGVNHNDYILFRPNGTIITTALTTIDSSIFQDWLLIFDNCEIGGICTFDLRGAINPSLRSIIQIDLFNVRVVPDSLRDIRGIS